MQIKSFTKTLIGVVLEYRFFSLPLLIMLAILFVRVPLGTFSQASFLDPIAHFFLPALSGVLLFAFFVRITFLPTLSNASTVFVIVLLSVFIEVLWEIFEYVVDLTIHLGWQLGNADTMDDLILAVVGSLLGALLYIYFYSNNDRS